MARIKKGSRHIVLLAAFVSVMSAAGGLLGAVTGAVFVLLLRSTFNMSTGIGEFVLTLVLIGAFLSAVLGLMLTVEWPQRVLARTGKRVPAVAPVAAVSAAQPVDGQ
jgi:hypothetical protein